MPEQPARPQENEADQQSISQKVKGDRYENNRYCCSGRIQCRN